MKKLFYLLILFSGNLFAQSQKLFEEANAAYAEGAYEEAIVKYNEILSNGETAAAVHFNLGNAHYKLDNIGPSIYHYEKALQIAPNDDDVKNNLEFAQNMAVDAIDEAPQSQFSNWIRSGYATFSTTGWGWIGIAFMLLFVCLFLAYFYSRRPLMKRIFFISGVAFLLLAIASVVVGYSRQEAIENEDYGIVFSEEAGVRAEPNLRGNELFYLHEGAKVEILEDFQEWSRIRFANGNQGWMQAEHFRRL